MVSQGTSCLGPVTQAGCGAICPAYNRGCYGCYGPKETPNADSLSEWMSTRLGVNNDEIVRTYRGFNAYADAFRKQSEAYEK
jgi:coenzyme F420-reducing hydrogenase gamma subunit